MSPAGCPKMSATPCNRNADESFPVLRLKSREQKSPTPLLIQDKDVLQPSLGVLPEGYIYPKTQRPVRDLLPKRAHLVEQQTANVLSVQNIILRNTGTRLSANRIKRLSQAEVDALLPNAEQALAVSSTLVVLHCLTEQMHTVENRVQSRLHRTPQYELLQTVDGIGPSLAQTILMESGA